MQDTTVLATVAGEPITGREVDDMIKAMGQHGAAYNTKEGREAILEELIGRRLLLLDAKRNLLERDEEFKAELAKVKDSLLSSYAADKAMRDVRVTDAEIEEYYNAHRGEFVSREKVNVSHILVDDETLCEKIMEDIERGDISFEEAARRRARRGDARAVRFRVRGRGLRDRGRSHDRPRQDAVRIPHNQAQFKNPRGRDEARRSPRHSARKAPSR